MRLLYLLSNHILKKVPRQAKGYQGADEDAGHRYWNSEQKPLDLALEHL
jgi:hypothetical protein